VSGNVFSLLSSYFLVRMPLKLIGSFHDIITDFDCTYTYFPQVYIKCEDWKLHIVDGNFTTSKIQCTVYSV
jgi:hypothetical protein